MRFERVRARRRVSALAPALALAVALAGCAGPAPRYEATPLKIDPAAAVSLVSAYRVRHGLNPVALNPALTAAAEEQAMAMAENGRMSHAFSSSDTLPARLAHVGYDWSVTAENVGAGYRTLDAAFAGWVGSPHHNENLLRKGVTEIGIAAARSTEKRYGYYWSLVLAGPRKARAASHTGPFGSAPAGTGTVSSGFTFMGLPIGSQTPSSPAPGSPASSSQGSPQ